MNITLNVQHDDTNEAAIAAVVERYADQIRDRARADHADELQHAGHTAAADYLRTNR